MYQLFSPALVARRCSNWRSDAQRMFYIASANGSLFNHQPVDWHFGSLFNLPGPRRPTAWPQVTDSRPWKWHSGPRTRRHGHGHAARRPRRRRGPGRVRRARAARQERAFTVVRLAVDSGLRLQVALDDSACHTQLTVNRVELRVRAAGPAPGGFIICMLLGTCIIRMIFA